VLGIWLLLLDDLNRKITNNATDGLSECHKTLTNIDADSRPCLQG
jgi:hypothetical protein